MSDVAGTLVKHRKRLNEVLSVLARHGLAAWRHAVVALADFAPVEDFVHHVVAPEDVDTSDGERLRGAQVDRAGHDVYQVRADVEPASRRCRRRHGPRAERTRGQRSARPARRRPGDSGGPARQAGLGTVWLF